MHTVIVGGTRGMGRKAVLRLASGGNTVSVIGQNKKDSAHEISSPNIRVWYADLTDAEKREQVCDKIICSHGPVNHLLFFQRYRGKEDKWQNEMETSLTVTKSIIEFFSDRFASESEKSIVIVSSVAAEFVAKEQDVGYHVAKAGLLQMTRYFAAVLGKKKIRVNCVSPAIVLKQEAEEYYQQHPEEKNLFEMITPLGRMGTSEDVVNLIEFLCSSKAAYITGQNIVIDGGLTLQMHASLCTEHFLNISGDKK